MAQHPRIADPEIDELLNAQTRIWNNMFSFIKTASLKCAVLLQIPDIIHKHGRPMSLPELVEAIPITKPKANQLARLMRILIHSGFFLKENDSYALAPPSTLLLKHNPLSARSLVLCSLHPILTQPWDHVTEWFQNDDPTPFDTANGMAFWEYAEKEPELNQMFNDAMASDARLVMNVAIKHCKGVFEGLNSVVDVGGGNGTAAKIIADAFPNLQCTVFDQPHVIRGLEGTKNLNYVGGDMFVSIPHADALFLKWILHNWSDEESMKILKKCKESIPNKEKGGGKVIIIDMVVESQNDESTETQILSDLLIMNLTTGRERAEKDWAKLFFEAGFSSYKITPVLGLRSIIEVYP